MTAPDKRYTYTSGSARKLSTVAASDLVEAIKWCLCAHMEADLEIFAMTWVYTDITHANLGFCRLYCCTDTPISAKQTQSYCMHIGYHGNDSGRFLFTLNGVTSRGNSYTVSRTKGGLERVALAFVRMRARSLFHVNNNNKNRVAKLWRKMKMPCEGWARVPDYRLIGCVVIGSVATFPG